MSNQINPGVVAATRLVTDKLAMDELIAIYMAAMQGFNPEPVMGYEKAKGRFALADTKFVVVGTTLQLEDEVDEPKSI